MSRCCKVCRSVSSWSQRRLLMQASSITTSSSLHRHISVMDIIPARISSTHTSSLHRQHRSLSSTGNQHHPSKLSIKGNIVQPVSDAQRRAAQLELDRMNESTSRILQMTSVPVSDSIVNETRVALNYWSRRWYMHFHPGFGRAAKGSQLSLQALRQWDMGSYDNNIETDVDSLADTAKAEGGETRQEIEKTMQQSGGDHGARQAEKLLDWSIENDLIPHGIFDLPKEGSYIKTTDQHLATSPNVTVANIIQTYLLPCEFGGFGGSNELVHGDSYGFTNSATLSKHFIANASYVRALADATRVMKKMKHLHSTYPDQLSPDTLSVVTELNVWSKRAIFLNEIESKDILAGSNLASNNSKLMELLKKLEHDEDTVNGYENKYTLQGCLDQMETILAQAESKYTSTNDDRIRPSVDWYNHVISAWARSDIDGGIERTKQILYGMEKFGEGDEGVDSSADTDVRRCWAKPNIVTYNGVLFGLARNQGKGSAKVAQEMLKNLKERHTQTKDESIRPDDVTYGTVLHSLAQAGMADEAESILDSLEDDYNSFIDQSESDEEVISETVVVPGLTIYNSVLNAWANSFRRNAAERSESLLNRMKTLHQTGRNTGVDPDMISLSTVMKCHSLSKTKEGTERAEELLHQAISMYHQGNWKVKPDAIMFNCALLCWASISGVDGQDQAGMAAERAELLLRKMKSLREDSFELRQDTQSFNIVLDCWAKSTNPSAAERALRLLREVPSPDECSYNSVLHAMTKQTGTEMVTSAEKLFDEMKELRDKKQLSISEITFHVMMNVYGKSGHPNGANKAEELLRGMQSDGLTLNATSYNICIDAYARRGDSVKAKSLLDEMIATSEVNGEFRPTIHSFAAVVNALAKSEAEDSVEQAQRIVRTVEQLDYVAPNSVLYNSLIDCITKNGGEDAPSQAEEILGKMQQMNDDGHSDVQPNPYAYSMVLTCCARSQDKGAAERADRLLMSMEQMYDDGQCNVIANDRCYSAVITAWARNGSVNAVQRSLELLDRMEENLKENKPHGKPNTHCYNACIHAIAKSSLSGSQKAKKCQEILQRMNDQKDKGFHDSAPSLVTYSTILNACAYASGDQNDKKEAFNLAKSCFRTLLEADDMSPCASCYTNFFLVISRLLKPGEVRDMLAEAAFKEVSASGGKIDGQVLKNFRNASPAMASKLLSKDQKLILDF